MKFDIRFELTPDSLLKLQARYAEIITDVRLSVSGHLEVFDCNRNNWYPNYTNSLDFRIVGYENPVFSAEFVNGQLISFIQHSKAERY